MNSFNTVLFNFLMGNFLSKKCEKLSYLPSSFSLSMFPSKQYFINFMSNRRSFNDMNACLNISPLEHGTLTNPSSFETYCNRATTP
mmetsp:Transcript_9184/g.13589  ORF Transcript_9184/g.13589 Transcript_9184/m.13589 type:complete len:86 (-) Transcript_9184:469-726(-)